MYLDADFADHNDDEYEEKYRFRGQNRDRKKDRTGMIVNGRGLKSVTLPLLAKKARQARGESSER